MSDMQNIDVVYDCLVGDGIIHGAKATYLGTPTQKMCRFCGKTDAEVAFRKIAHVFPQSIGNNPLRSNYECDICNKFFGDTLEDCFAKYFMHLNTLAFVKGEKKVPTYKSKDGNMRVEAKTIENTIYVNSKKGSDYFVYNEVDQTIKITFDTQPFVPVAVFKCLVKMALSIMPEKYLNKYADATAWLMEKEHRNFYDCGRKLMMKFALLTSRHFTDVPIIYGLYKSIGAQGYSPDMMFYVSWGQVYCMIEVPLQENNRCFEVSDMPVIAVPVGLIQKSNCVDLSASSLLGKAEVEQC